MRPLPLALPRVFALVALVALVGAGGARAREVEPAVERGVALGLFATDPAWDYGPLLDEVKELGATHVLVAVVWTQKNVHGARIHRRAGTSPDDATILRTLAQVRERGMRATLFPIVRLEEHTREEWRGRIAPKAGVDAWFASYRDFVLTMARLAQAGRAARLSIGSELVSLEHHDAHWRALIADVRRAYGGRLVYSANWDHFVEVPFWDAVDDVGVTAYFELAKTDALPDDDALDAAWSAPMGSLAALKAKTNKPLLVTEVGYPSLEGAARWPWDETRRAAADLDAQRALYDAFCRAFRGARMPDDGGRVVDGFYAWNWFGFGGRDDTSYTPRKKPAARALARCLRAAW